MRRGLSGALFGVLVSSLAACGGSSPSPSDDSPAGLQAAATTWARAFLTGTVADIQASEGVECRTHPNPSVAAAYLAAERKVMARYAGQPLGTIKVLGVDTRNVTSTTGDAEVRYNLPAGRAGNDNWVSYKYESGSWKVANCHAPIGGESSRSSSASSSAP